MSQAKVDQRKAAKKNVKKNVKKEKCLRAWRRACYRKNSTSSSYEELSRWRNNRYNRVYSRIA